MAAKKCYDVISIAKGRDRALGTDEELKVFEALNAYYKLTAFEPVIGESNDERVQKQPIAYKEEGWAEISTWEEVELMSKYRENLKGYLYIKFPKAIEPMQPIVGFDSILKDRSGVYQYTSGVGKTCEITGVKEQNEIAVLKYKERSEPIKYLIKDNAKLSTFLPKKLVDFIYFLEDEDINNISPKMSAKTDKMKPKIKTLLNEIKKIVTTDDGLIPCFNCVVWACDGFIKRCCSAENFREIKTDFKNRKINDKEF